MGDPARSTPPAPSSDALASEVASALAGFGSRGVVEVWLLAASPAPSALVVTRGEDTERDARVRRHLALVSVARVAFVPEEFGVRVARGVCVLPAAPPDNSAEAARARGERYADDLARQGIAWTDEVLPMTEAERAELLALGLR